MFRLFGKVYLEHRELEEWEDPMPFYLVNCPVHGPFEDFPHGWERELRCLKCLGIVT